MYNECNKILSETVSNTPHTLDLGGIEHLKSSHDINPFRFNETPHTSMYFFAI